MNEAILKWLASGTIGLVVCSSLWLAGSVQHDVNIGAFGPIISHNTAGKAVTDKARRPARPAEGATPVVAATNPVSLN